MPGSVRPCPTWTNSCQEVSGRVSTKVHGRCTRAVRRSACGSLPRCAKFALKVTCTHADKRRQHRPGVSRRALYQSCLFKGRYAFCETSLADGPKVENCGTLGICSLFVIPRRSCRSVHTRKC